MFTFALIGYTIVYSNNVFGQTIAWTNAAASTAWYTATVWTPNTSSAAWLTTNLAQFNNTGTATTAGINMNTASLSIGAIEIGSGRTRILTIGNSSTTVGTLTLNGITVNSNANTILRNASNSIWTLQNNETGTGKTMNIALANTTDNKIYIDGTGNIVISSVISGSSKNMSLNGTGSGNLVLAGANTFNGTFTVNNSITRLNINNALGSVSGITIETGTTLRDSISLTDAINNSASVTINGTGTLDLPGSSERIGSLTSASSTSSVVIGYSGLTAGSFTVGDANNTTFAGVISGTTRAAGVTGFTKQGSGILELTGANTFTGKWVVSAGTLRLNRTGGTTIPAADTVAISGGTLRVSSNQSITRLDMTSGTLTVDAGVTLTITGNYNLAGGTINCLGTIIYSGGTASFPGSATINNGTANTLTNLEINSSGTVTLSGNLIVDGTLSLTSGTLSTGTNTLTISGSAPSVGTGVINASSGTISFTNTSGLTLPASLFTGNVNNFSTTGTGGVTIGDNITITGTATIGSGSVLTLGNNTFLGTGTPTLTGTGTISFATALSSQIGTYNTNTFSGTYRFTGSSLPATTYTNLSIASTSSLAGNVEVTGTFALNSGTLTVGANTLKISSSSFSRTTGNIDASAAGAEVDFANTSNISVPASSFTGNIYNLSKTGSGYVTVGQNLTVANMFTLSNGVLNMGTNTLEVGTSTGNVGTLNRTAGGVRGKIKRWFATNTPTTSTIFPVTNYHWETGSGYVDDYNEVAISFTGSGPSTGGSLTVQFDTTGSGSLPGGFIDFSQAVPGVNLINLSPQFWTITPDGLAGFVYNIDVLGNGIGISPAGSNYSFTAIVKRNTGSGNTWAWSFANHANTSGPGTNPQLHGVGFTSFSDFAVAGNIDNLLPVELTSFTASVNGNTSTLNWSTVSEENNSGFDIERKSGTGSWSKIGFVEGHGTVNTPSSYIYTDRNLVSGKYNYRLKQIDFNGNYKYYELSNEVIIGTPTKYALSQNFPNPFNPSTTISYEIPASNFVSLKIYDMMGKEVANLVNATQEAGFYTVKFDASKLASGVYFYKLQANDFTATKKLMLMK